MATVDFTAAVISDHAQTCTVESDAFFMQFTRHIVAFDSYQRIEVHTSFIKQVLSKSNANATRTVNLLHSYQVIARANVAVDEYPTDFIVLHIYDEEPLILSTLTASPHIKYVHADRMLYNHVHAKRKLLHQKSGDATRRTGGRLSTPWLPFEDDDDDNDNGDANQRALLYGHFLITEHLGAQTLWNDGFDGSGVNVAVFDTGIDEQHSHFTHIDERTNWTDEDQLHDGIGHGTFVAGIIASKYKKCPGFAPQANIHTFRVFTNAQNSYTSWFLDAFNYAIHRKMNILNLSIGGPDWLDLPFVDKVREMQANNVIMITACGNDGKYGTINNPADQLSVIGVGGITQSDTEIASFQSRGMTTWELPDGYGRVKPDVVTVGQSLYGSAVNGECRTLSGTSVASPVVTGVAALLTSVVPIEGRWQLMNPASLKQVLVESADSIAGLRLYEQGNGKVNLQSAYRYIQRYEKHVSAVPDSLDLTQCPYAWPFCRQPLYHRSQPYVLNVTLLNPFSVVGEIADTPTFEVKTVLVDGRSITQDLSAWMDIRFRYSEQLWPWCGWLGIYMYAPQLPNTEFRDAIVSGVIAVDIRVMDSMDDTSTSRSHDNRTSTTSDSQSRWRVHSLSIPWSVRVIPTPPRHKRILWDQFHNLAYPRGYFPRDDLEHDSDMLDWFGDHLHTNYHTLYDLLRDRGYFVEILSTDYSCIDAADYATLVLVDEEDEFHADELRKVHFDVLQRQLSLIIFADWYNEQLIADVRFFDDNTRSMWDAYTGGANVVALNQLLQPFGIVLGNMVTAGSVHVGRNELYFQTGSNVMRSPVHSRVLKTRLHRIENAKPKLQNRKNVVDAVPLVLYDTKHMTRGGGGGSGGGSGGRIAVFGDSTCLDANQHTRDCFWLLEMLLRYTNDGELDSELQQALTVVTNENEKEVFSSQYVAQMSVPQTVHSAQSLLEQVSRTHHLTQVKCAQKLEAIKEFDSQKNAIKYEPLVVPVVNNKHAESDSMVHRDYKVEIQPHVSPPSAIHFSEKLLLLYPFLFLGSVVAILCCICRPVRRMCANAIGLHTGHKYSSPMLMRKHSRSKGAYHRI